MIIHSPLERKFFQPTAVQPVDRYRTVIVNSECRHVPILREGYGAGITDYCTFCPFKFPPVCV